MGADFGKSIKVGPPPKEFAERNMAAEKFYELRWNGETRIIDQVLVQYADGTYDINNYATQVKIISMLTHGYLPCERRYAFPIIAERKRPTLLAA
jgi:predicted adenine nucleotide alpha hydrolase (AANH) superfamily ATPase